MAFQQQHRTTTKEQHVLYTQRAHTLTHTYTWARIPQRVGILHIPIVVQLDMLCVRWWCVCVSAYIGCIARLYVLNDAHVLYTIWPVSLPCMVPISCFSQQGSVHMLCLNIVNQAGEGGGQLEIESFHRIPIYWANSDRLRWFRVNIFCIPRQWPFRAFSFRLERDRWNGEARTSDSFFFFFNTWSVAQALSFWLSFSFRVESVS